MKLHLSTSLLAWSLAVGSMLCIVTAVRIEYLNYRTGGAIQRKAEQEPHSKWRTGRGFFNTYEQVEANWRKEHGKDDDAELNPSDYQAIEERVIAAGWSPSPSDRLGKLLGSWGLVQYPLAAFLVFASLRAARARRTSGSIPCKAFYAATAVGVLALGLAFYRGYFSSLGW
ncbi:hypothetical protein [Haloferula rosea]|uniref:Uncharacterized protein n=1 Tax=Haloferula rosea TaxID=490093 RepID=A0A934R8X3_9BACT|nr:hypothetical protein [Haloferula rosea]MBK1826477.1 hypothetical protein [Haloferula rosea]